MIQVINEHELTFAGKAYRCAIGAGGFTDNKKEGDKATPLGTYALRDCWYREDRLSLPKTILPVFAIRQHDGWCDACEDGNYNKHVQLPYPASHENLWRNDHSYDVIVPIGFNDGPIIPGKGSAIFFHIAKQDYSPTLGCIAVSLPDMLEILGAVSKHTQIKIAPL